jgi:hypothetical protein
VLNPQMNRLNGKRCWTHAGSRARARVCARIGARADVRSDAAKRIRAHSCARARVCARICARVGARSYANRRVRAQVRAHANRRGGVRAGSAPTRIVTSAATSLVALKTVSAAAQTCASAPTLAPAPALAIAPAPAPASAPVSRVASAPMPMLKTAVSFVPARELLAATSLRRDTLRARGVRRGTEPGGTESVGILRENVNGASGGVDKTGSTTVANGQSRAGSAAAARELNGGPFE